MALTSADVQRAFQNALGRAPSQADVNAFLAASQSGTSDASLYVAISNSREADLNVDPVVRFYQAVFGRVPDKAGLDNASDYIRAFGASAQTYQTLATQFAQSPEFQARYGTGTAVDSAYVQSLYRDILGRNASASEIAGYTSGSNGFTTRGQVLYAISQSQEAIGRSDSAVNAYLQDAAEGDSTYTGSLFVETTPPQQPEQPNNPGGSGGGGSPGAGNTPAVIAGNLANTATEDQPAATTGALTVTDADAGQATFQARTNTVGNYGSFTLAQDGGYTYTLDARAQALAGGQTVTDSFAVASADGTAGNVVITVTGVNDAAVITGAVTNTAIEDQAQPTTGTLAVTDADAGQATFQAQTNTGTYGSFTLAQGGGYTYTLDGRAQALAGGQVVTDTFGAPTADGTSRNVVITVTGVNDAPTAANLTQSLSLPEDSPATNLFTQAPTVADVDSASVTATLVLSNNAAGLLTGAGTSTVAGGTATYTITGTPAAVQSALAAVQFDSADNFNGNVTVGVSITDGQNGPQGTNPTGIITINGVTSVNDAPAGSNSTITLLEDGSRTFSATDFGFTDPVDAASASGANALRSVIITTLPTAGTLTLNGAAVTATQEIVAADLGNLRFTPAANANGTGYATFTFQVRDDGGTANGGVDTDPTPNTVTFSVTSVNDAPSFTVGTNQTVDEDAAAQTVANFITNISAGPNESSQAVTFSTSNTNNSLFAVGPAIAADGTLTYTLAANANGSATVSVNAQDNGGTENGGINASATQSFTITANAVNDAPTATNLSQPLTIAEDAAPTKLFTQAPTVADIDSTSVTATLTLDNAAAGVLTGATAGATAGVYTVTGTADQVSTALAAVQFDSAQDFNGSVNVGVAISDGVVNGPQGTNPIGTVTITVTAANDAPVAVNDTATAQEAGGIDNSALGINPTGNVLTNDTDVDAGDTKTVQGFAAGDQAGTPQSGNIGTGMTGTYGELTLDLNGNYTYVVDNANATVNALNTGSTALTDTFTYTAKDAVGLTSTATLTVSINGANDAPVVNSGDTVSVPENTTSAVYTVTANDVDNPTGPFTYAFAGGDDFELFNIDASTGVVTFKTAPDYELPTDTGTDNTYNFNVTASDGAATSAARAVALTVTDVNEGPPPPLPTGRVLFVSDSTTDTNIPDALRADGHTVDVVESNFSNGSTPALRTTNLSLYEAVIWSATADGFGSGASNDTAMYQNLSSYVQSGGYVFVTGRDAIADDDDPNLITFLGGANSIDGGNRTAIVNEANALTTGVKDIRGLTPETDSGDFDTLALDANSTVSVVVGSPTGAEWTLRSLGNGEIAWVSNGLNMSENTPSWAATSNDGAGAYNAALRNFVYSAITDTDLTPAAQVQPQLQAMDLT